MAITEHEENGLNKLHGATSSLLGIIEEVEKNVSNLPAALPDIKKAIEEVQRSYEYVVSLTKKKAE